MDYRALAEEMLESMALQKMPTEEPSQISSGERGILNYLHFIKNGAFAGEISRDLGISTGRTAIALKNLEKKGLVARSGSEKDKRRVIVHVTAEGSAMAESFHVHALDLIEAMLQNLGERDATEYVRIFKRIMSAHAGSVSREESQNE